MTRWMVGGHRGDQLELFLEHINYIYKAQGIALIDKIPTPVKVLKIKQGKIVDGYYEKKSTVDYHGIFKGNGLCYDAKETEEISLPLKNIHEHQVEYMNDYAKHGGYSFIVCQFKKANKYYFLPIELINKYWEAMLKGGRKSIPMSELDDKYLIPDKSGLPDYIKTLELYIQEKKEQQKERS